VLPKTFDVLPRNPTADHRGVHATRSRLCRLSARNARVEEDLVDRFSAADLAPIIAELQAVGITSLTGIAAALQERGVPTPAGSSHWRAVQVRRLLARLAA
jgi:hypothetical protein